MTSNQVPPQFGKFDRKLALELLTLVKEAHRRYETRKWSDRLETKNAAYTIHAHLIFTQTVWALTDIGHRFRRENYMGFIAQKVNEPDLYVVFRGTSNVGEWITNVKFIQQSYTTVPNRNPKQGETHWGFRRTYDRPEKYDEKDPQANRILWATQQFDKWLLSGAISLRETIENKLLKLQPLTAKPVRIYVAGHSLGGALATLASAHILDLVEKKAISSYRPILYSFASPRVGDDEFAKTFDKLDECYRIFNSEDLVPQLPPPTFVLASSRIPGRNGLLSLVTWLLNKRLDFRHVGTPIAFTAEKDSISDHHTLPVYFEALEEE